MARPIAFVEPRTLDEAVAFLAERGDEAKVVAGATALTILLRTRLISPSALVSLRRLPGLRGVESRDGVLRIGALVTHREAETSPLVRRVLPVLSSTFARVASVRVRCAATVGGVLAEADYASDPPCVFVGLDADVVVRGSGGERRIPAGDFFLGFFETALAADEIVTAVEVPLLAAGTGAVYTKYSSRSAEDRPCVGVFAAVRLAADGRSCEELRVSVGATARVPQRLPAVERTAQGLQLTEALAASIADAYAEQSDPLADVRGSAAYRREMIRVWVRRSTLQARELAS